MAEILHETVHYTGHVQGVGFRHAVLQVAREFEVAGYVQNLADGRVRLEAPSTEENAAYLETKRSKLGHLFAS
jgi:acylphosphatase